ncbi:hypothetical protein H6788_02505 [Candidatus Nomurabacteria bacterium]|nr:hypothetical protein [Candidatus Nomurabacteria bacterium]MCB9819079.1 hypothetical protein [Candidatus Nomurabacteria bacterium]
MTNTIKFTIYGVASIATLSLMMFVVLPQLPQISGSADSLSTSASSAEAWDADFGGGCCGGDSPSGDIGGGDGPLDPITPAPVCSYLNVSTSKVPAGGGNVTFSWSTSNASGVTLWGAGESNHYGTTPNISLSGSKTVFVDESKTFWLDVWNNAGQTAKCTASVSVEQPVQVPAPVCNYLNASTTKVPAGGGNVTFSWSTTNASGATLWGNGESNHYGTTPNISLSGSKTVFVNGSKNVWLDVWNSAGQSAKCSVSITVDTPIDVPAPVCNYLNASTTKVPAGGGNVTFSWSTSNASGVTLWGSNESNHYGTTPNISLNGSKTVFVDGSKTFWLDVWNSNGGTDKCTVKVTVEDEPEDEAPKCDFLRASRTTVPAGGADVTLNWETTNTTSVSINNGVGSVSMDGSKTVRVNSNTTFILTATGTSGSDSCTVTITKESDTQAARCEYLRVSDDEVEEGDDVTLTWDTTNATSVSINQGIGNVSADGSKKVEINDDTTFTLTATGTNGSDTCTVRVEIEDEDDNKKSPKCELDISRDRVKRGEKVTLSWETKNVDEIVIKDDRGNTIFDTDDYSSSKRKKYLDGEIDIIINQSTEFRMKAEGEDGGSRTCKVDVDVDDIAVYEKRDQALVIALTQVPYTGFEAGAFLTFLFYAVLTLWALFIAYILVVKKGSVLGFSLYGAGTGMSETDTENRKKVEALVAKYADQSWK